MNTTTTATTTKAVNDVTQLSFWEQKLDNAISWITTNGLRILIAFILMIICFKIINMISKRMLKRMQKRNVDKTVSSIVYNLFRKGLKILLFIAFIAYVGIDTASIGAVITAAGVGVGLALQGSLSNLAGGIVIVIMRPFKIGDYIEAQGEGGTVEEIKIFYTYIITPDNRTVMIPNGVLANGVIRNNSLKDKRRVDFEFQVAYDADINLAKELLVEMCVTDDRVDKNPAPFVKTGAYTSSAVVIKVRVWTDAANYWDLYFDFMKMYKEVFDANGIEIPYDKLDVTIKKD